MARDSGKNFKEIIPTLGINTEISVRGDMRYCQDAENVDTGAEGADIVTRAGYVAADDEFTLDLDIVYEYRDPVWNRDVLLVYQKSTVVADRRIRVFTKTLGSTGVLTHYGDYAFDSLDDNLFFLQVLNTVRIGNGTENNALFAGYIDRTGTQGMFGLADFDTANFLILRQQWVQQPQLFSACSKIIWDSVRSVFYVLTQRGLEIKDSDFYTIRTLADVVLTRGFTAATDASFKCNIAFSGDNLYVCGKVKAAALGTTKLVQYDCANNYKVLNTVDKSGGDYIRAVCTDGSFVWLIWTDGGTFNGRITEYDVNLGGATNRYAKATAEFIGAATDGTNVFTVDEGTGEIVAMLAASPYTASLFSHGITVSTQSGDIDVDGTDLYWCADDNIRKTDVSDPHGTGMTGTAIVHTADIGNINAVSVTNAVPYSSEYGKIVSLNNTTSWTKTGYVPGKVYLRLTTPVQPTATPDYTLFYGVSFVDIDGQFSHLMPGLSIATNDANLPDFELILYAVAETFTLDSPSQDPATVNSIWGMYKRIKTVILWRAYAGTDDAQEPTTNYRFHSSYDIDSSDWVVNNVSGSNYDYAFIAVTETTTESEMGTVSFEEFTGLKETLRPSYTNWKYAVSHQNRTYYANIRTTELNTYKVVRSEIDQPDSFWESSGNSVIIIPGDGDEIKGIASVWNRVLVMKSRNSVLLLGLIAEKEYQVGLQVARSLIVVNDTVYFVFADGIYVFVPQGFQRISRPVDAKLKTFSLTGMTAAWYLEKDKIIWHVPESKSFVFNRDHGTWDVYNFNTGTLLIKQVVRGLNQILLTETTNNRVHKISGSTDLSQNIPFFIETKEDTTTSPAMVHQYHKNYVTYKSPASLQLTATVINRNGSKTNAGTLPVASALITNETFMAGFFGHSIKYRIAGTVNSEARIRSITYKFGEGRDEL